MQARLTDRSRAAWDRTLSQEGVTITAFLESLGLEMAESKWHPPARVIKRARQLDRERHSR